MGSDQISVEAKDISKRFVRSELVPCKKKRHSIKKKSQNKEFYALKDIQFVAKPGEIVGILGQNGAGKTTLLRILGMLMKQNVGEVRIWDLEGREITDKQEKKKQIGYLSGNTKLYHRFSTRELLKLLGEIYGMTKKEVADRTEFIVNLLSMQDFADNRIERLSTGQTQRASIARCLLHNPSIYIFDEPTLGLDIVSSEAILQFMMEEKKNGKCILYSTHYMEEAEYLCDRVVILHKGVIIAEGTPKELMQQTGTTRLRDVIHVLWKEAL